MVTIVDPHLKRDDNYLVFSQARDKGLLVKNKDGGDFDGWCWPGEACQLVKGSWGKGLGGGGQRSCFNE